MMKNNLNTNSSLQDRLTNFDSDVNLDNMWSSVEAQLPPKKERKRFAWIWLFTGLAIALIAIATVYLSGLNNTSIIEQKKESNFATSDNELDKKNENIHKTNSTSKNSEATQSNNSNTKTNSVNSKTQIQVKSIAESLSHQHEVTNTDLTQPPVGSTSKKTSSHPLSQNIKSIAIQTNDPSNTKPAQPISLESKSDYSNSINLNNTLPETEINISNPTPYLEMFQTTLISGVKNNINQPIHKFNTQSINQKTVANKKWLIGIQLSSGIVYQKWNQSSIQENRLKEWEGKYQGLEFIKAGIRGHYQITDYLESYVGIDFKTSTIKFIHTNEIEQTNLILSRTDADLSKVTTQRRIRNYNTLNQWAIPFGLGYKTNFANLEFGALIGSSYNFHSSYSGKELDEDNLIEVVNLTDDQTYKSAFFNLETGIFVGKSFNNWSGRLGLNYTTTLGNIRNSNSLFEERQSTFGLSFGVYYKLYSK